MRGALDRVEVDIGELLDEATVLATSEPWFADLNNILLF